MAKKAKNKDIGYALGRKEKKIIKEFGYPDELEFHTDGRVFLWYRKDGMIIFDFVVIPDKSKVEVKLNGVGEYKTSLKKGIKDVRKYLELHKEMEEIPSGKMIRY